MGIPELPPPPENSGTQTHRSPLHRWLGKGINFWQVNLLFWSCYAAAVFLIRYLLINDVAASLWFTLFSETTAFLFSLVLLAVYRRLTFESRTAVILGFLSLMAAVALAGLSHFFAEFADWHQPGWNHVQTLLVRIVLMWMVYMGWSFGFFWLRAEADLASETRLAEEAVREAHRMELRMLRAQLDPHFLFNSLNGIVAEVKPHPETACEMIRELSDYLRYSLEHRKRVLSPLGSEVEAMTSYLEIEKTRFGGSLKVAIAVEDEARWTQVPSFLLQPLVENAVKHGSLADGLPMNLTISACMESEGLRIEVTNTGTLKENYLETHGLGIDTLRRRLELHYPGRHSFRMLEREGTVHAMLVLKGDACRA